MGEESQTAPNFTTWALAESCRLGPVSDYRSPSLALGGPDRSDYQAVLGGGEKMADVGRVIAY